MVTVGKRGSDHPFIRSTEHWNQSWLVCSVRTTTFHARGPLLAHAETIKKTGVSDMGTALASALRPTGPKTEFAKAHRSRHWLADAAWPRRSSSPSSRRVQMADASSSLSPKSRGLWPRSYGRRRSHEATSRASSAKTDCRRLASHLARLNSTRPSTRGPTWRDDWPVMALRAPSPDPYSVCIVTRPPTSKDK